ncbi:hypothetical protein CCYA_CCYA20G4047 [Cyanidiococcus yangmingshanensis]|nr:hypothetical protein CCYA_CCYA20G4047 [Cyanidiococcus yangmingshanensis]
MARSKPADGTRSKRQRDAAAEDGDELAAALCQRRAASVTKRLVFAYASLVLVLVGFPLLYTRAEDNGLIPPAPQLLSASSVGVTLTNMLLVSSSVVFIGAHVSASRASHRQWVLEQLRQRTGKHNADSVSAALADLERDVIGRADALRFPLIASLGLLGLFLAIRYLPPRLVQWLLGAYVSMAALVSLTSTLSPLLDMIEARLRRSRARSLGILLSQRLSLLNDTLAFHGRDLVSMAVAASLLYAYRGANGLSAAMLNNVFAASLGVAGIDLLAIGDFQTAVVLLLGLFLYDIFWVFGSESIFGDNVMVSVARGIDGPFKFVFFRPRTRLGATRETSMLGLGDLVIPGLFVALMLRFDNRRAPSCGLATATPYFWASYLAYALGMVTTFLAMAVFHVAQPALLYLVPLCLAAPLTRAWFAGELRSLWHYREPDLDSKQASVSRSN